MWPPGRDERVFPPNSPGQCLHIFSTEACPGGWQQGGARALTGVGCVKGFATGESDELLGDMDPLEMDIKWLHSPMVKIADAMENKTTVYKVPVPFLHGNRLLHPGLWEMVSPLYTGGGR